jgi:hypothetical protein
LHHTHRFRSCSVEMIVAPAAFEQRDNTNSEAALAPPSL